MPKPRITAALLVCFIIIALHGHLWAREGAPSGSPVRVEDGARTIKGIVFDRETGEPIFATDIFVVGTEILIVSDLDGRFTIREVPEGPLVLKFRHVSYDVKRIENLLFDENQVAEIVVELEPNAIPLKAISVTPSQFSIMGTGPSAHQYLTREDLETVPLGEDIYRAIRTLPGISSGDYTAKFNVRGGENEEVLVLLDGMELYAPFHLKDIDGGTTSIIDVAAIEGIDLITGGFTAEYGDRLSGVFNMTSKRAREGKKRTSVGVSFMNARVMSEGTFNADKGAWFLSARRGYLDLILSLMDEDESVQPVYYDIFGKVESSLGSKHILSGNFLHAGDRFDLVENDDDESDTGYGNTYGWLNLKSVLHQRLFVQTVASYGRLTTDRNGIGYTEDLEEIDFHVTDERVANQFGFKQDWNLDLLRRWHLKWGFDFKKLDATYDYLRMRREPVKASPDSSTFSPDTTRVAADLSGRKVGTYLSNRFRIAGPLIAEAGIRYDHTSYANDNLLSPRINLVCRLGEDTFLRAGWGRFAQSQGIHEIRVGDGEGDFLPAQIAQHWVAGLEHTTERGIHFRVEGYFKKLTDLHPDYRNWSNVIEVFPEAQHDRYKLNLSGATSRGIETYLKYDRGGRITWWAGYALAYADDDVRSLVFQDTEYTEGAGKYPGPRDQRHTLNLDLNYRPNRNLHWNLAWQFHSGWPHTRKILKTVQREDGFISYNTTYGQLNGERYSAYHRLDLRFSRHFHTSRGRISTYFALINVYNRGNERNIDYVQVRDPDGGYLSLVEEKEYWFELLPSIGVSWSWES